MEEFRRNGGQGFNVSGGEREDQLRPLLEDTKQWGKKRTTKPLKTSIKLPSELKTARTSHKDKIRKQKPTVMATMTITQKNITKQATTAL